MDTYIIVYGDDLYWVCQADDVVHACEQFENAEPDEEINKIGLIVWISP